MKSYEAPRPGEDVSEHRAAVITSQLAQAAVGNLLEASKSGGMRSNNGAVMGEGYVQDVVNQATNEVLAARDPNNHSPIEDTLRTLGIVHERLSEESSHAAEALIGAGVAGLVELGPDGLREIQRTMTGLTHDGENYTEQIRSIRGHSTEGGNGISFETEHDALRDKNLVTSRVITVNTREGTTTPRVDMTSHHTLVNNGEVHRVETSRSNVPPETEQAA